MFLHTVRSNLSFINKHRTIQRSGPDVKIGSSRFDSPTHPIGGGDVAICCGRMLGRVAHLLWRWGRRSFHSPVTFVYSLRLSLQVIVSPPAQPMGHPSVRCLGSRRHDGRRGSIRPRVRTFLPETKQISALIAQHAIDNPYRAVAVPIQRTAGNR